MVALELRGRLKPPVCNGIKLDGFAAVFQQFS
jgi:hypothetical protein